MLVLVCDPFKRVGVRVRLRDLPCRLSPKQVRRIRSRLMLRDRDVRCGPSIVCCDSTGRELAISPGWVIEQVQD